MTHILVLILLPVDHVRVENFLNDRDRYNSIVQEKTLEVPGMATTSWNLIIDFTLLENIVFLAFLKVGATEVKGMQQLTK